MKNHTGFPDKYGPWALVAGASEGLGEAFSIELASHGLNVALLARRVPPLERLARDISERFRVETKIITADMGGPGLSDLVEKSLAGIPIGSLVVNAAFAPVGGFFSAPLTEHERLLDVNCRGALRLLHLLVPPMLERKRGGVILMSSLAGFQGTACVAHYAASKAYLRVLAEGLWEELRESGVDVMACCAGMTDTPTFRGSRPRISRGLAGRMALMKAGEVAKAALDNLGSGPIFVPGAVNQAAALLLGHVLPRSLAVRLISRSTRRLYREDSPR
ncbi:MAG: SDR family NAD(P)-dependent oxidoreductase [Myxococcales bacterium]|nr:SDR family NAD(P)-dependent oxidoreductase [Myxococcales bacterium]